MADVSALRLVAAHGIEETQLELHPIPPAVRAGPSIHRPSPCSGPVPGTWKAGRSGRGDRGRQECRCFTEGTATGKPQPSWPWGPRETSEKGLRELGRMWGLQGGGPATCVLSAVLPTGLEAPGVSNSAQDLVAESRRGWLRERVLCWPRSWEGEALGPQRTGFSRVAPQAPPHPTIVPAHQLL